MKVYNTESQEGSQGRRIKVRLTAVCHYLRTRQSGSEEVDAVTILAERGLAELIPLRLDCIRVWIKRKLGGNKRICRLSPQPQSTVIGFATLCCVPSTKHF